MKREYSCETISSIVGGVTNLIVNVTLTSGVKTDVTFTLIVVTLDAVTFKMSTGSDQAFGVQFSTISELTVSAPSIISALTV